jgi:hypothetical protein
MYRATQFSYRLILIEEVLSGDSPDRENQARLNPFDLTLQVCRACLDFLRTRISVGRRPALQNIRDIDIAARQANRSQHLIQQQTRFADERFSDAIFVRAGRLANDHPVRSSIANAENGLSAGLMEWTLSALRHLCFQTLPRIIDIVILDFRLRFRRRCGATSGEPDRNVHSLQDAMLLGTQEISHPVDPLCFWNISVWLLFRPGRELPAAPQANHWT